MGEVWPEADSGICAVVRRLLPDAMVRSIWGLADGEGRGARETATRGSMGRADNMVVADDEEGKAGAKYKLVGSR